MRDSFIRSFRSSILRDIEPRVEFHDGAESLYTRALVFVRGQNVFANDPSLVPSDRSSKGVKNW